MCSLNGVGRKYWSTSPSCAERYARVRTMRLSRSSRSGVGGHCWENRIPSAIWAEKTRKANAQHSRSTLKARNLKSIHGGDATNYQTEAGLRNGVALDSQKVGIVATHITIPVDMASGRMHMAVTHPQHYAFGTRNRDHQTVPRHQSLTELQIVTREMSHCSWITNAVSPPMGSIPLDIQSQRAAGIKVTIPFSSRFGLYFHYAYLCSTLYQIGRCGGQKLDSD